MQISDGFVKIVFALASPILGLMFISSDPRLNSSAAVVFFAVYTFSYSRSSIRNLSWLWILLWGVCAHSVAFHWVVRIISTFGNISPFLSIVITAVIFIFASLQFVIVHVLTTRLHQGVIARFSLALPLAWLTAETIWPQFIPWYLADSVLGFPWLVAGASLLGSGFLGFLLLWISSVLTSSKILPLRVTAVVILFGIMVYGNSRSNSLAELARNASKIRTLAVQGNLDPFKDFRAEQREANISRYRSLTAEALRDYKPDLVIWPETSVGYDYFVGEKSIVRGTERDPMPGLHVPLVFGGQLRRREEFGGKPQFYNSVIALGTDGEILGTYRKQELFPFSERAPLWGFLPLFAERPYTLLAGIDEQPLRIALSQGVVFFAAVICFEDLWPGVVRKMATDASLLLAVSNDNWFLDSIASMQHHHLAAMRAVETGRGLLRVTNSGFTGYVNPLGETERSLPVRIAGVLPMEVPLVSLFSLYTVVGDFPVYFIVFITFALSLRKRKG